MGCQIHASALEGGLHFKEMCLIVITLEIWSSKEGFISGSHFSYVNLYYIPLLCVLKGNVNGNVNTCNKVWFSWIFNKLHEIKEYTKTLYLSMKA